MPKHLPSIFVISLTSALVFLAAGLFLRTAFSDSNSNWQLTQKVFGHFNRGPEILPTAAVPAAEASQGSGDSLLFCPKNPKAALPAPNLPLQTRGPEASPPQAGRSGQQLTLNRAGP